MGFGCQQSPPRVSLGLVLNLRVSIVPHNLYAWKPTTYPELNGGWDIRESLDLSIQSYFEDRDTVEHDLSLFPFLLL